MIGQRLSVPWMAQRLSVLLPKNKGSTSASTRSATRARHLTTTATTQSTSNTSTTTTTNNNISNSKDDRLIVVGSGVAGSAAALIAAETHQKQVLLIFAGETPHDCNSYWAQGGIIYKSPDDPASLAHDIHRAGAGLCLDAAVQKVATEGPSRVDELLLNNTFAQVPFDCDNNGNYSLCLEASHSAPRILHHADCTGAAITKELAKAIAQHPNITLVPHTLVTNLLTANDTCVGVQVWHNHSLHDWRAHQGVVLCAGGLAGIYQHSTNPSGFNALGSAVALATRANVTTNDLEYVQFHPTSHDSFLLTEALRGDGGVVRNAAGEAFCHKYHPDAELAPRDIVSRAVFQETKETQDKVYLDMTHKEASYLNRRFPTIQEHLKQYSLDLAKDWIPITPAAHYTCGGVATDLQGQTSLSNLYAAGEAARTGLHGGNRLASTSLLEGLVFGASVADAIASDAGQERAARAANLSYTSRANTNTRVTDEDQQTAQHLLQSLKQTMWDHVGVVRTRSALADAVDALEDLQEQAHALPVPCVAVRDATTAGLAVAKAALANPQSAGAHCVEDDESDEDVVAAGVQ